MHTPTNFDQTDRASPLVYYNNAGPDENLSDSSNYSDNEHRQFFQGSDLRSLAAWKSAQFCNPTGAQYRKIL